MRRSTIAQRGALMSKLSNPISRTSNSLFALVLTTVMIAAVTADPKARFAPVLTADVVQAFRTGVAAAETNRTLTAIAGLKVGHYTLTERPTGCTVILVDGDAVGGVSQRGGAPGTSETDLLNPLNMV